MRTLERLTWLKSLLSLKITYFPEAEISLDIAYLKLRFMLLRTSWLMPSARPRIKGESARLF